MDALEFAKQRRRMCSSFVETCEGCDLQYLSCHIGAIKYTIEDDKVIVRAVEQWASEHPEKTRQSEFLKIFTNAKTDEYGVAISPCYLEKDYCKHAESCDKCREEYWQAPVEDEG